MIGRGSDDSLYGYYGHDTPVCGEGVDNLDAYYGNDTLYVGPDDDTLRGGDDWVTE